MKNKHYYLTFIAFTFFLTSCSKDEAATPADETTELISDLLVNPELLSGYWNIENNTNASKSVSGAAAACEVSLILFNQDKTFKIKNT